SGRTHRTGQENVNSLFVGSVWAVWFWPFVINMLTVPKCRAVRLLSNVSHIVSFFPCNSPCLHRDRTAPPSQYPLGSFTPLDSVVFFTRFETKSCLTQRI